MVLLYLKVSIWSLCPDYIVLADIKGGGKSVHGALQMIKNMFRMF